MALAISYSRVERDLAVLSLFLLHSPSSCNDCQAMLIDLFPLVLLCLYLVAWDCRMGRL